MDVNQWSLKDLSFFQMPFEKRLVGCRKHKKQISIRDVVPIEKYYSSYYESKNRGENQWKPNVEI